MKRSVQPFRISIKAISIIIASICLFAFRPQSKSGNEGQMKIPLTPADIEKIESIIASLTLEEKVEMLHSNGLFTSAGTERLGVVDLHYSDGPHGVREEVGRYSWIPLNLTTDSATFFPTGSALAATWNPEMALKYGIGIGEEARTRGKEILLGPAINITRTPVNGRTYEYLSEDPLLNAKLAAQYVKGVQQSNVVACVKHYAVNNQETNRGSVSAEIDERTLREIYLPAFKSAIIDGGAYAIMSAYNKVRGIYCAENEYLINKILKEEWGFDGIVVSDWGGTHSTVNSALYGIDVEMGSNPKNPWFGKPLIDAVNEGKVPMKVIDDKVRRILKVMFYIRKNNPKATDNIVSTPEHHKIVYDIASQSIVLLKNSENLLPLDLEKITTIAMIGDNANKTHATGGFGAGVKARYEVTPFQGLKNRIGNKVKLRFAQGYVPEFYKDNTSSYGKYPENKAKQQLINEAVALALDSDIAIIFAGTNHEVETESADRKDLLLPFGQDELIKAVTAVNPKTIIVVAAGGPTDLSTAIEHSSSIVYSWWNGTEGGNALADVLTGKVNPSGKLPFTFPKKLDDSPAHYLKTFPGENQTAYYKEGILVGYRWFDTKMIEPQFCFGHGLSYTSFKYSDLKTNKSSFSKDDKIKVSLQLENTGKRSGYETVQLYINKKETKILRPLKELKAFKKPFLNAGEKVSVSLELNVNELAYYSEEQMTWIVEPGEYEVIAAASAKAIKGSVRIYVE